MAGRFDKPGLWGHGLTVLRANGERRWSGKVGPHQPRLGKPLHWRDPRGVFVNSTSDVFHERMMETEDGRRYIAAMFGVMAATPRHTYMILTKRPHLMREWFEWFLEYSEGYNHGPGEFCRKIASQTGVTTDRSQRWPLPNVWLGATTENQDCADRRIPDLLRTPAAVRFLSCEPLLGPVDLSAWLAPSEWCWKCAESSAAQDGDTCPHCNESDCLSRQWGGDGDDDPGISWVITGGESGPKARPSHPDWFRSLRDQCTAAGVAHFFKQWGEWAEVTDYSWTHMVSKSTGKSYARGDDMPLFSTSGFGMASEIGFVRRVGKKTAGRELDGREWSEFPDV